MRAVRMTLLLLFGLLLLPGCSGFGTTMASGEQPQPQAVSLVDQALALIAEGRPQAAAQLLALPAAQAVGTVELPRLHAWALAEAGEFELAASAAHDALLATGGEDAGLRHVAGLALARSGKPAEALPHLRAALDAWPDYPALRLECAQAEAEAGYTEAALANLEAYRALAGEDAAVAGLYAELQFATGNYPAALDAAERALATSPGNFAMEKLAGLAAWQVGASGGQAGSFRLVERHMRAAVALDPQDATVHFSLACALDQLEKGAEAEAALIRTLELDPEHRGALGNLGELLFFAGRFSEAKPVYMRLLEIETDPGRRALIEKRILQIR